MPLVQNEITGFNGFKAPEAEPRPAPDFVDTLGAAFRLENDVVNAFEIMTTPTYSERDPTFNLVQTLKDRGYWENYKENFIGVGSLPEFNHIASKIEQEQEDRDTLSRAGWPGFVAMIGAGMLSPTLAFPLLGPARGARGVLQAMGLAGGAAALQELPLVTNQVTRTPGEVGFSIAASTVLGGILGGAVIALRKGEFEALEQSMANSNMYKATPYSSGGADVTQRVDATSVDPVTGEVTGLARGANRVAKALDTNPLTRSPVTDNLTSTLAEARWTTAQLSDAGLMLSKNAEMIPTTPGGTAENRINTHYGKYADYVDRADTEYYNYMFDNAPPKLFPGVRAAARAYQSGEKMSRAQFNEEVFRAAYSGDVHENEFVARAAKALRETIYEPILKELQAVKLLAAELKEGADPSYINWVPKHEAIREKPQEFVDFLQQHYEKKLNEDFAVAYEKHVLRKERVKETIDDMNRSPQEIELLRDQFGAQLKALEERMNASHFTAIEDTVANLRAQAALLKDQGLLSDTARKQMLSDARDMEKQAGPQYAEAKLERRELKRRLSNLNKAKVAVEEKLANKLEKIERAEELSINSLNRVARAGQRFLNEMENWSDEVLDEELSKLKTQFETVARIYDKGEERLTKMLTEEKPDPVLAADLEYLQKSRADRMTEAAEKIADAEDLGRDAMRSLINDMLQEVIIKVQRINEKRAVRTARLRQQAESLTPEAMAKREADLNQKIVDLESSFSERVRLQGGLGDPVAGKADFSEYARQQAFATKDRFLGTTLRLPIVDMMLAERGAVLPRLLGFIPTREMERWLERDVEKVAKTHLRTMAPDIEITRKLGSVNGAEQFENMRNELNRKLDEIKNATVVDKDGNVKPRDEKWKAKETKKLQDEYDRAKLNLEVIINRLRHLHGLPSDPDGMSWRLAKTVMDLNVLRYMGMVVPSSLPDIARPIMRYGITRTFRDGFVPMITMFKELKPVRQELRRMGVAIETLTALRQHALMDTMDDLGRGTKFERGVQYLSGKQGIVAGFNIWTDLMKQMTGLIANAKVMDTIGMLMEGKKLSKADMAFLASNGIDEDIARRIWKEVENGGAMKINGVWLPNTQAWTDELAKSTFRAALVREANNTIITPGVEKPAWTTASTTGRLLAQFKSFALTSTYKTLMAGLQQQDRAFAEGVMASLALGALSYYVGSMLGSDAAREKMLKAGLDEWADAAVQRSGVLGAFGLGQDLLSRIPATSGIVSFSGGRSVRREGDDFTEALLGPSFAALVSASQIATGIDDPTKSTAHQMRLLLPWQNTIGLREIFDTIEANLPVKERRQ